MGSISVRVVGNTVTHIEPVLKGSATDKPEAPTGDPTATGGKSSVGGSPAVDNGASNPDNIADSTKLVQDTDKRKGDYGKDEAQSKALAFLNGKAGIKTYLKTDSLQA